MASVNNRTDCCCNSDPCRCPKSSGCIDDFCIPRPCFFSGQLVTAEDFNSMMTYFSTKQALFAKLVAGWGVLGGMRLMESGGAAFGLFGPPIHDEELPEVSPCLATLTPNPQVVAGSKIRVTAGAAIDAAGQTLTMCEPQELDLLELSAGVGGFLQSRTCGQWFGDFCADLEGSITGTPYWVVARRVDKPGTLAPVLTDVQSGNPSTCNFSRINEEVEITLVREIPALYFLHGCCTPVEIPCLGELLQMLVGSVESCQDLEELLNGPVTNDLIATLSNVRSADGASQTLIDAFGGIGFKLVPQLMEFVNSIPINTCCDQPGVVLGRVVLATGVPHSLSRALGEESHYVFIDDAFPYRRLVPNGASNQLLWTSFAGLLVTAADTVHDLAQQV